MLFLTTTISCVRHSDLQDIGDEELHGVWKQDSSDLEPGILDYTQHEFRIVCDSVYVTMHVNSTVQRTSDSCFNGGHWTEYAKAVYVVRGDSMLVEGVYTKPNGKQKISGCYRSGQYTPRYLLTKISKDSIVLQNRFEGRPIVLHKTADVTCIPKKRWEL